MGIIELSDITVRRGRNKVLDNWSLSVDSGEVVCLSGDNGCGKSTVIETAAGLIPLENGSSTISGQLIRDSDGRRGRTGFGRQSNAGICENFNALSDASNCLICCHRIFIFF